MTYWHYSQVIRATVFFESVGQLEQGVCRGTGTLREGNSPKDSDHAVTRTVVLLGQRLRIKPLLCSRASAQSCSFLHAQPSPVHKNARRWGKF